MRCCEHAAPDLSLIFLQELVRCILMTTTGLKKSYIFLHRLWPADLIGLPPLCPYREDLSIDRFGWMWLGSITTLWIPPNQGNEKWPSSSAGRTFWIVYVDCVSAIPLVQRESHHCKRYWISSIWPCCRGESENFKVGGGKGFSSINNNTTSITCHSYRWELGLFYSITDECSSAFAFFAT